MTITEYEGPPVPLDITPENFNGCPPEMFRDVYLCVMRYTTRFSAITYDVCGISILVNRVAGQSDEELESTRSAIRDELSALLK